MSFNWIVRFTNYVWIWFIPTPVSLTGEASSFITISRASLCVAIFCCIKGILICGTNVVMNHSLRCTSFIPKQTFSINVLNRWWKSQIGSFGYWLISFNSMIYCTSDLDFMNSSINPIQMSTKVFTGIHVGTCTNFMYHSSAWPQKVVAKWHLLTSSS